MPEELGLKGLKCEMEKLADHLAALEGDSLMDPDAVGELLRALLNGETATNIIEDFGLVSDEEEEPGA